MKTQTQILGKQIILHKKVLFDWQRNLSVLIKVRRVHYSEMGKAPTTMYTQGSAEKLIG